MHCASAKVGIVSGVCLGQGLHGLSGFEACDAALWFGLPLGFGCWFRFRRRYNSGFLEEVLQLVLLLSQVLAAKAVVCMGQLVNLLAQNC